MEDNKNVNVENTDVEGVVEQTQTDVKETKTEGFDINKILENDEFKKYMAKREDQRVTDAVKKRDEKWQKQLEEEKKKLTMTEEELKQQQENEKQNYIKELESKTFQLEKMDLFRENNFNMDLYDFAHGSTSDEVKEKASKLTEIINNLANTIAEQKHKEKFDRNIHIPKESKQDVKTKLTDEMISKMSQEELVKYLNQNPM